MINLYDGVLKAVARILMAFSNSFLSPFRKKTHTAADIIVFGIILSDFLFYTDKGILCVLIRIASMRRFK